VLDFSNIKDKEPEPDKFLAMQMHGSDKRIGKVVDIGGGYKIFFTEREENHFFRMYRSFNLSTDVANHLFNEGVQDVIIQYTGREFEEIIKNHAGIKYKMLFRVPLRRFLDETKTYTYKENDVQKAVCVYDMELIEKKKIDEVKPDAT
jgi:hypothetical protein